MQSNSFVVKKTFPVGKEIIVPNTKINYRVKLRETTLHLFNYLLLFSHLNFNTYHHDCFIAFKCLWNSPRFVLIPENTYPHY